MFKVPVPGQKCAESKILQPSRNLLTSAEIFGCHKEELLLELRTMDVQFLKHRTALLPTTTKETVTSYSENFSLLQIAKAHPTMPGKKH